MAQCWPGGLCLGAVHHGYRCPEAEQPAASSSIFHKPQVRVWWKGGAGIDHPLVTGQVLGSCKGPPCPLVRLCLPSVTLASLTSGPGPRGPTASTQSPDQPPPGCVNLNRILEALSLHPQGGRDRQDGFVGMLWDLHKSVSRKHFIKLRVILWAHTRHRCLQQDPGAQLSPHEPQACLWIPI